MSKPNINTTKAVMPMIYCYSTPEIRRHDGWTKIGYTEQDVITRIKQQTHTANVKWNLEWQGNATFDDGSGETFKDKVFHAYLRKLGVEQEKGEDNEWFHIDGKNSHDKFVDFRMNKGITKTLDEVIPYTLRDEQNEAVGRTLDYMHNGSGSEFLWNAKPRFGKTLSTYDLVKKSGAKNVLIVTNRPAIANSWFDDYAQFMGSDSGYLFVSEVDALKNKAGVLSREEYNGILTKNLDNPPGLIEFVSLQDLKGSLYFGGQFDKLSEITTINWDILVIDEAHEGVDTYKTDVAFDRIKRKFTLHLSGTPFKALASYKFADDAIYNWTYADEQQKKRDWDESKSEENPYEVLPRLNLFTYQMSEIIKDELSRGIDINGETEEYAFDLNEFFSTTEGRFNHGESVDRFLDALTTQTKFPFSTPELRDELNHTFWILDRVESAKALAKKLAEHPVFKDYEIVLAAGDGRLDENEETKKSYDKVREAINNFDKTITLSVGQLTTGITIPEWTAVLMLSNMRSPALYMQAAFRAQNPCLFKIGTEYRRKENSYVFDFDPARTLDIFEQFANNLSPRTAGGGGTAEDRKENVKELLNFFPVIGEDENGELVELDAEKVLTIPRKIRSLEVVRRGFMSNFLFQNISNIFGAPKEVIDIIQAFEPVEEPKPKVKLSEEVQKDLMLDEDGNVDVPEEFVIGRTLDVFGDKIFGEIDCSGALDDALTKIQHSQQADEPDDVKQAVNSLKESIKRQTVEAVVSKAKESYGSDMKPSDKRAIESMLNHNADRTFDRICDDFSIRSKEIEAQRVKEQQRRNETGRTSEDIQKEYDFKKKEMWEGLTSSLHETVNDFADFAVKQTVKTVETNKKEREKRTIEDGVRDHLRGFSRTIPSFLMAYGDNTVTLATFDNIIPGNVFKEVTSITLDQFKFLRDGGDYVEEETGLTRHFDGQLFDSVVFDDSVKEFLALKKKLADYFDEKSIEDIFDYIPPQKTNQIFTPKDVVKKMVDMLEEENPGCFDRSDKTFIDLYMKSGLYITEIVKRLYQSPKMKAEFPDSKERLRHIFEKQVYGLAPTEIIYKIATSYILGFDDNAESFKHNFRQVDALPYAKDGTLQAKLDELFPEE